MRVSRASALFVSVPLVAVLSVGSFGNSWTMSRSSHLSAVSAASAEIRGAEAGVRGLNSDVLAAETSVEAASGRVLDPSVLDAVTAQVAIAEARAAAATVAADLAAEAVSKNTIEWSLFPWEMDSASEAVKSIKLTISADAVAGSRADLEKATEAVSTAVTAWEAEQERLAAVKAEQKRLAAIAAEKAAAEAKARAARPVTDSIAAPPAAAARNTSITVNVRTNVTASYDYNGLDALDAGGQVGIYWPGYGTVVAAHNYNDSRALDLRVGDLVTFTGAQSGKFRVSGSIDVPRGTDESAISSLGVSMYMQTRYFNDLTMRVVGLVPA